MALRFRTDNEAFNRAFASALDGLARNVRTLEGYSRPVLIEGAEYSGVWLECAPHEGLLYSTIDLQIAVNNHLAFFENQRVDGYLPCWVWANRRGTGQIQMVVPIAATAYELFKLSGDIGFLEKAYSACRRWDEWLRTYRDTRKTGLCELFCGFDTGHDGSPRVADFPEECPDSDARKYPNTAALPYLAPDLSATVYGGRVALAKMAEQLGREREAVQWRERAEHIRRQILAYCFDAESLHFYDVDANHRFRRIRGDALTRVLSEHVADQELFEAIYQHHIKDPARYWTPYPLPSIAYDDPAFIHTLPPNSWGGAAQALTAMRVLRWFEHYGKYADLSWMMTRWIEALCRACEMGQFWLQQMNPITGTFTPAQQGYSPAMLVMLDYTARLYGVHHTGDALVWACGLPPQSKESHFELEAFGIHAALNTSLLGSYGIGSTLHLHGEEIAQISGMCRVITDLRGRITHLVGIQQTEVRVCCPRTTPTVIPIRPDEIIAFS